MVFGFKKQHLFTHKVFITLAIVTLGVTIIALPNAF
jgi:hypothetical protein